jgi:hypothetical protein
MLPADPLDEAHQVGMLPEGLERAEGPSQLFVWDESMDGIVTVSADHDPLVQVFAAEAPPKPPVLV